MKMSLYSVIDGHGGDQCAHYLRKHFEQEIIKNLTDTQKGFYAS
jgi:serine/threonine protein phosphatase PrpC